MTTTPANPQRRFSTRLIRKGVLIEETYSAFRAWALGLDMKANWARLRDDNPMGASNSAWLRETVATLSSRFRSTAEVAPLVVLARGGFPLAKWRACLLWYVGQQDALVHDFLCDWLYDAYRAGVPRIRTDDVVPFVIEQTAGKLARGAGLSTYGQQRAARSAPDGCRFWAAERQRGARVHRLSPSG